jgi:hypothetical protein
LGRIPGEPTDAQLAMAKSLAFFEWGALAAENEGSLRSLGESREHRRLLLRVLEDFEASLRPVRPEGSSKRLAGLHDRFGAPPR